MRMDRLRGPDSGTLLVRAIRTSALSAECSIRIVAIEERPWASATFVGTRYRMTIAADPVPHLRSWIDALPEADLPIRGHIVADLAVEDVTPVDGTIQVTLAVLTLMEG